MKVVGVELWCPDCNNTVRYEDEYDAPNFGWDCICKKCNSKHIMLRSPFVTCDCGTTVYLGHSDTECEGCGQAYNAFGDKITHMGFTEEDW